MKKIKILMYAFVTLNFFVSPAYSAEIPKNVRAGAAKDVSDWLNKYRHIGVVCVNEDCFRKIENSYAKINCTLIAVSTEQVDFERSFTEKAKYRKYRLEGCMMPLANDDAAGLAPVFEKKTIRCLGGYKSKLLNAENGSQTICTEDDSLRRERLIFEKSQLERGSISN